MIRMAGESSRLFDQEVSSKMWLFYSLLPLVGIAIAALSAWFGSIVGRGYSRPDLIERNRTLSTVIDQSNIRFAKTVGDLSNSRFKVTELQGEIADFKSQIFR